MSRFVRRERDLPARHDGLGEGWAEVLTALNRSLMTLDPPARAAIEPQGSIAVFDPARRQATRRLCDASEQQLAHTCERCGTPGTIRATPAPVILAMCDDCSPR